MRESEAPERGRIDLMYRLEKRAILPLKWTILVLCLLLAMGFAPGFMLEFPVFLLLLLYGASTAFITYLVIFERFPREKIRVLSYCSLAIDVLAMTALVCLTGGLRSDFYILFFLLVLRGAGFFPTAKQNSLFDVIISILFVLAIYLGQPDLKTLASRTFLIRFTLLCGVVLLSWYLMRIHIEERENARRLNDELLLQSEYHRNLLESMTNGVIATDEDRNVITVNWAASRILERSERDILEGGLDKMQPQIRQAFETAYQNEEELTDEQVEILPDLPSKAPQKLVRLTTRRIRDGMGNTQGVVAILEDLSALRHAEERLWRSERLASVGQLAAGLAHELGNPIGIIKSCAGYMKGKVALGSPLMEDLNVIDSESDRCQDLVRQLLSLASQEQIRFEKMNLNEIVQRAISLVRYGHQSEDIELEECLAEHELQVNVDENLLIQAFVNVLLNAVQASEAGATVTVTTFLETRENRSDAVALVCDEGTGMDGKTVERIFDPFFTTKDKGAGLGLSITHRIIERMGGEIEVESQAKRGTTIGVRIPLVTG